MSQSISARLCNNCKKVIPKERLEALPETETCVNCSTETKVEGVMLYSHKTAGVLSFLPSDPEQRRQALNAHNRTR